MNITTVFFLSDQFNIFYTIKMFQASPLYSLPLSKCSRAAFHSHSATQGAPGRAGGRLTVLGYWLFHGEPLRILLLWVGCWDKMRSTKRRLGSYTYGRKEYEVRFAGEVVRPRYRPVTACTSPMGNSGAKMAPSCACVWAREGGSPRLGGNGWILYHCLLSRCLGAALRRAQPRPESGSRL